MQSVALCFISPVPFTGCLRAYRFHFTSLNPMCLAKVPSYQLSFTLPSLKSSKPESFWDDRKIAQCLNEDMGHDQNRSVGPQGQAERYDIYTTYSTAGLVSARENEDLIYNFIK